MRPVAAAPTDPWNLSWTMPAEEGDQMSRTAVVTAGGDVATVLALARYAAHIPSAPSDEPLVVAADQGWTLARRLDLAVDVLVGDLDSVTEADLAAALRLGVDIRRHPTDKDATDLDLAMRAALDAGVGDIVVCDGGGERFDHGFANVLTAAAYGGRARVTMLTPNATITVVTASRELRGETGDVVSLVPVFGPVRGIITTGLLYPLSEELLSPGSSRGVSNELVGPTARVSVEAGTLLAIQPGRSTKEPR